MATTTTDTAALPRATKAEGSEKPSSRGRRSRSESSEENNQHARYFLAKAGSDGAHA